MTNWIEQTVFYHIYPLGLCDCPAKNDYLIPSVPRLNKLYPWVEHIADMGFNGLYIGPLFESGSHGYDTTDYYRLDRRLGENSHLTDLIKRAHGLGIKVILDGVLNHVGRDFWAFKDVLEKRENSAYKDWFAGLTFDGNNRHGDGLSYETWEGHETLVKFDLTNKEVQKFLFDTVQQWVREFDIDGLRLDAANVMDLNFLSNLASLSHTLKPDFWLMGEVVAGDYRNWVNINRLDSVTNYECYKGLYSSFNDHNLFEISWSLNRQFGEEGLYRDLLLYSFADNHDVDRIISLLKNPAHLIPLYVLMFSMPGVPSIYYGSEFGVRGEKKGGDALLRPALDLTNCLQRSDHGELLEVLRLLIDAKKKSIPLQVGSYRQLLLTNEQFAFVRETDDEYTLTMINVADHAVVMDVPLPQGYRGNLVDLLQPDRVVAPGNGSTLHLEIPANSARLISSMR